MRETAPGMESLFASKVVVGGVGHPGPARWQHRGVKRADTAEAAKVLRLILAAVERGELHAGPGHGAAILRLLEGAAIALEESSQKGR